MSSLPVVLLVAVLAAVGGAAGTSDAASNSARLTTPTDADVGERAATLRAAVRCTHPTSCRVWFRVRGADSASSLPRTPVIVQNGTTTVEQRFDGLMPGADYGVMACIKDDRDASPRCSGPGGSADTWLPLRTKLKVVAMSVNVQRLRGVDSSCESIKGEKTTHECPLPSIAVANDMAASIVAEDSDIVALQEADHCSYTSNVLGSIDRRPGSTTADLDISSARCNAADGYATPPNGRRYGFDTTRLLQLMTGGRDSRAFGFNSNDEGTGSLGTGLIVRNGLRITRSEYRLIDGFDGPRKVGVVAVKTPSGREYTVVTVHTQSTAQTKNDELNRRNLVQLDAIIDAIRTDSGDLRPFPDDVIALGDYNNNYEVVSGYMTRGMTEGFDDVPLPADDVNRKTKPNTNTDPNGRPLPGPDFVWYNDGSFRARDGRSFWVPRQQWAGEKVTDHKAIVFNLIHACRTCGAIRVPQTAPPESPEGTLVDIVRVFNGRDHAYLTDPALVSYFISAGYRRESVGSSGRMLDSKTGDSVPVRMYMNSATGDSYYTLKTPAADGVPDASRYQLIQTIGYAWTTAGSGRVPWYRLRNAALGDTMYTTSAAERDAGGAWKYQGIAGYVAANR